jgi:hypothetical protein
MQSNTDNYPVNRRKKSGLSTLMLNKIKRAQARVKEERFVQEWTPSMNQQIMLVGRRYPGKVSKMLLALEKAAKKAAYLKLLKNKIEELESQKQAKDNNVQKVSIGQTNIVSANILWPLYLK